MEGTPFGRYRLIELLGRGGMGEVWRAFDPTFDRVVALKVLSANLGGDAVFQERFRREAKAAAGLDEPHVVPIFDFGEVDGRLFVTMRLIDGRDLQALLADGPLAPHRAVGIIEQVAFALDAAHRIGLVHRDVKPSNILVAERDFTYLIDFGIARTATETGLTSTGAAIGTWSYMAPERFRSGQVDPRSDVYALACVLHQTLTGQLPFPGGSLEQQMAGHMFDPVPRPSASNAAIPAAMDKVIANGLAKIPTHRYASTQELATAARDALTAEAVKQAPPKRVSSPPAVATDPPTAPPTQEAAQAPRPTSAALAPTQHAAQYRPELPISDPRPNRRPLLLIGAALVVVIAIVVAALAWPNYDTPTATTTTSSGTPKPRTTAGTPVSAPILAGNRPLALAIDAGTNTAWITNPDDDSVSVIDTITRTQIGVPIPVGKSPQGVAIDSATHTAWIANWGDGTVSVIDTTTRAAMGDPIYAGAGAGAIAIDPTTHTAWITHYFYVHTESSFANTVSVVDTNTREPVGPPIPVGLSPRGVAIDSDTHTAWITNFIDGTVSVIDTTTRASVGSPIVVGNTPKQVAIDPGTATAWIATNSDLSSKNGLMFVIDTATRTPVGPPIPVGRFPALSIDTGRRVAWIAGESSVSVIDTLSRDAFGMAISVEKSPKAVAIDTNKGTAWVTNYDDGTVTVVGPLPN